MGIGALGRANTVRRNHKGKEASRAGGGGTNGYGQNPIDRQSKGGEKAREQTQSGRGARDGTHRCVNDGGEDGAGEDDRDEESKQARWGDLDGQ